MEGKRLAVTSRFLRQYLLNPTPDRSTQSRPITVLVKPTRLPWRIVLSLRRAPIDAKRRLAGVHADQLRMAGDPAEVVLITSSETTE